MADVREIFKKQIENIQPASIPKYDIKVSPLNRRSVIGSLLDKAEELARGALGLPDGNFAIILKNPQGVQLGESMNFALYRTFDGVIGKLIGGTYGVLDVNGIYRLCLEGDIKEIPGSFLGDLFKKITGTVNSTNPNFGDYLREAIKVISSDGKGLVKIEEVFTRGRDNVIRRKFVGIPIRIVRSKTSRAPLLENYLIRFLVAAFDEDFVDLDDVTGLTKTLKQIFFGAGLGMVHSSMFWGTSYL